MSEDPFGNLGAVVRSGETDSGPEPEPEPADEGAGTDDAVGSDDESATESASAEPANPRERPVFEFGETVHKALCALEAVADKFDDIITYDVEHRLTRSRGLKDVTKSELRNATLTMATEHPEEIIKHVLEQRGIDDKSSEQFG